MNKYTLYASVEKTIWYYAIIVMSFLFLSGSFIKKWLGDKPIIVCKINGEISSVYTLNSLFK